ncbi:integrase [Jeotgalibacillus alimentarius]|uniref:Integrase n=1 Tax=Jeotgalibacillus alimentarius TaxID=135826 RepID=A0A0C2R5N7_9BACL|nr:tyrosine-type recombinase/integrase [Jeotgalibacillus alimentarius]KIL45560.1 integrase [Jeotgalibacillus alimentarius]
MNQLRKEFEQWLIEDGKSPKTIESYSGDLKSFQQFLTDQAADESQPLSRFAFVKYKEFMMDGSYAIATMNKKINSLKVYHDFLIEKGVISSPFLSLKRDRVKVAAGSEHEVTALSDKEVNQLLFYVNGPSNVSARDRLIVYLLLFTGIRVSECIQIKRSDIDPLTSTLKVNGKGGKIREISLRVDVLSLIRIYEQGERASSKFKESDILLLSQRQGKMHRDAIRVMLAKIGEELGFHLHPHLLRHTFGTRLIRRGVDLTTVSKLLGHSSVVTSAKFYVQISKLDKKLAVDLL